MNNITCFIIIYMLYVLLLIRPNTKEIIIEFKVLSQRKKVLQVQAQFSENPNFT